MGNKKSKWLAYTVLVGLIPIICRMIAWLVTKSGTVELLASSDFVALGLVLHISIINEMEHISDLDKEWKTIQNGLSTVFMVAYGVLFTFTLLGDKLVDISVMKYCTIALSALSFTISYSVFDRISKIPVYISGDEA
jgi:CRISPR/Cas system CMR-associated protein Cmr3 (group 5 of RAMP superfamily)